MGEVFGNGGFVYVWIVDQKWVVFVMVVEDLDIVFDFVVVVDQRIYVVFVGFCVEIDVVFFQCVFFFIGFGFVRGLQFFIFVFFVRVGDWVVFVKGWIFGYVVGDVVYCVIVCYVLFLQEVGCVVFVFCKDCDQNVGVGDFGVI